MAKFIFFIPVFLMINSFTVAQTQGQLEGKWEYKSIYESEKLDAKTVKMLNSMFSGSTFSFNSDGTYDLNGMGKEESGTYALVEDGAKIKLTDKEGRENVVEIKSISDTELVLTLGGATMVLSKKE